MKRLSAGPPQENEVRERILATATELFYSQGIRAVGVDLVVKQAGVAKTSLYRHFGTKDDLVVAFLQAKDRAFWKRWDETQDRHRDDPRAELDAQLQWIGELAGDPDYRGCPQLNIAAEYSDREHPARRFATEHKRELRRRLRAIAEALHCRAPETTAGELALLINGAFVSTPLFEPGEAPTLLKRAAAAMLAADATT